MSLKKIDPLCENCTGRMLFVDPKVRKLCLRCPGKSDRELWWFPWGTNDWRLAWVNCDQVNLVIESFLGRKQPKPASVKSQEVLRLTLPSREPHPFTMQTPVSSEHSILLLNPKRKNSLNKLKRYHSKCNIKRNKKKKKNKFQVCEFNYFEKDHHLLPWKDLDRLVLMKTVVQAKYRTTQRGFFRRGHTKRRLPNGEPLFNVSLIFSVNQIQ